MILNINHAPAFVTFSPRPMSLDSAIMPAGDNPPPYSTVAATPECVSTPESSDV